LEASGTKILTIADLRLTVEKQRRVGLGSQSAIVNRKSAISGE
jgi:hypothetical protein